MFLKMNKETGYFTSAYTEQGDFIADMINVHPTSACAGRGCAIHDHPSKHPLRHAPLYWRQEQYPGTLERICEHGIHHPDHDSALYLESIGMAAQNIHTCDGCC